MLGWTPHRLAIRRNAFVDEGHRPDRDAISDRDAAGDDRVRADEAVVADLCRRPVVFSLAATEGPPHAVVAVDLRAGANRAVVADLEPAGAVEHDIRSDPGIASDFDV